MTTIPIIYRCCSFEEDKCVSCTFQYDICDKLDELVNDLVKLSPRSLHREIYVQCEKDKARMRSSLSQVIEDGNQEFFNKL